MKRSASRPSCKFRIGGLGFRVYHDDPLRISGVEEEPAPKLDKDFSIKGYPAPVNTEAFS